MQQQQQQQQPSGAHSGRSKARIVQYFQQLAIITPYAQLEFQYSHSQNPHRNFQIRYDRRSEQMPELAKQVKHHPTSVNNLVIQQLMERVGDSMLLHKFLTSELSSISPAIATRIINQCGWSKTTQTVAALTDRDVTKLVQVLRRTPVKPPDGSCLSPLGEYNLNLGIRKVLNPDYVATARDKPAAYDGHSFLVEAAVSLGGSGNTGDNSRATAIVKEGITVLRFANRIPLLFEGGADVSTRVAMTKLKWSNYKIDPKRDKIGVFVSIVSTKIPYKGTGKEYIGDDITEISKSVKRVLQLCCQQLRTVLIKRKALRDQRDRKSKLTKYIPDVSRALFGLLEEMRRRRVDDARDDGGSSRKRRRRGEREEIETTTAVQKRAKSVPDTLYHATIDRVLKGEIDETFLSKRLHEAVIASTTAQENGEDEAGRVGLSPNGAKTRKVKDEDRLPLYLRTMPCVESTDRAATDGKTEPTSDGDDAARGTVLPGGVTVVREGEDLGGGDGSDARPASTLMLVDHPLFVFQPLPMASLSLSLS